MECWLAPLSNHLSTLILVYTVYKSSVYNNSPLKGQGADEIICVHTRPPLLLVRGHLAHHRRLMISPFDSSHSTKFTAILLMSTALAAHIQKKGWDSLPYHEQAASRRSPTTVRKARRHKGICLVLFSFTFSKRLVHRFHAVVPSIAPWSTSRTGVGRNVIHGGL